MIVRAIKNASRMWQGESLATMLRQWEEDVDKQAHDLLMAQFVGKASRVADLGCGNGRLAVLLPDAEVYEGFDSSPEMLESARKRCSGLERVSFTLCNVFEVGSDEFFDVVVLHDVVIHQEAPLVAVQRVLDLWSAECYIFTLLVGPMHEKLYASVVVSNDAFELFFNPDTMCQHRKRVGAESFDWVVLEIS